VLQQKIELMRREKQLQAHRKHNRLATSQSNEDEPELELNLQQDYSDDESPV
jgi:hypothetical protein